MPAAKKIGFAVVGLGLIARNSVLPAFSHCRHAALAAVVSRDGKKAAKLRSRFHAASSYSTQDYDACLANPAVDAIYIATPQGAH
jgi:predicted dehydrogenase